MCGHIAHVDDNADAKRILLASPLADWIRHPGRPCIMRLSTVQQDLRHQDYHLRNDLQSVKWDVKLYHIIVRLVLSPECDRCNLLVTLVVRCVTNTCGTV